MTLLSFSRVNEIVSIRPCARSGTSLIEGPQVSRDAEATGNAAPHVILFLSWSNASLRHIEKYTTLYSTIWPNAQIVLVESGMADFFYRTEATSRRLIKPVLEILDKVADDALLVHIMSNAGSKQWCTINTSYLQSTGRTLSSATTIIDSAPGHARFRQTWAALTGSLPIAFFPRVALGAVFGIFLGTMHLAQPFLGPDLLEVVRTQMNDPAQTTSGVRRCYMYCEEDEIVGWEDVEDHARDAEQKGWIVELVKFPGSMHVGHFKQDPKMYQETIQRTWYEAHGNQDLSSRS